MEASVQSKGTMESLIKDKKDEVSAVERKVTWELTGQWCKNKTLDRLKLHKQKQCRKLFITNILHLYLHFCLVGLRLHIMD